MSKYRRPGSCETLQRISMNIIMLTNYAAQGCFNLFFNTGSEPSEIKLIIVGSCLVIANKNILASNVNVILVGLQQQKRKRIVQSIILCRELPSSLVLP